MSQSELFTRQENKDMPVAPPDTKIVEAYGLGKCPKLVQQIAGSDLDVRINALAVLCDEFRNPYSIEGCAREGAIRVLGKMIKDPDFTTRVRATNALALTACDANGLFSIVDDEAIVVPQIISGVEDPSEVVREHVYNALFYLTKGNSGVASCVNHGIMSALVKVLPTEVDSLKAIILKTINNVVGYGPGLTEAIQLDVVKILIDLLQKSVRQTFDNGSVLYSPHEIQIVSDAAKALGFICFDGRGKEQALQKGAIENLVGLLKFKTLTPDCKASITIAIMAITSTNSGKIQVNKFEGTDTIIALLYDDNKVVVLNTLKIISNIAIFPKNREILTNDSTCVVKLRKLTKVDDKLVAKHAGIALASVLWNP